MEQLEILHQQVHHKVMLVVLVDLMNQLQEMLKVVEEVLVVLVEMLHQVLLIMVEQVVLVHFLQLQVHQ